jgi:hypothetical protein
VSAHACGQVEAEVVALNVVFRVLDSLDIHLWFYGGVTVVLYR